MPPVLLRFATSVLSLIPFALAAAASTPVRPNFLILIADDLTWSDLGCTGNPDVKTPNIDRLRSESLSLGGMYTPASCCSPARHALYTGLYPVRSGAYPNHTMVDPETKSLFTHLKAAGYRVGLHGKTHISPRESFPYEVISSDPDDAAAFGTFIQRDAAQPWFAVFASHDPHGPHTRGPKGLYDPKKLTVPPQLHDNATTRETLAAYYAEITQLDIQVGAILGHVDTAGHRERTFVLFLSEQGASFGGVGKWSLYENGIRVATFARWPGHIAPGTSSDALVQYVDVAPTFLAAAGINPTTIDTGCPDASGARGFDGRSFLDVLSNPRAKARDYIFGQSTTVGINGYKEPYPIRGVRDTRYKYIRNLAPENTYTIGGIHTGDLIESWKEDARKDPRLAARLQWLYRRPAEELYDLQSDPYEQTNLAANPDLAPVKARLARELDGWMTQQRDEGLATELRAPSRQPRNAPDADATKEKSTSESKGKKKKKKG